MHLLAREESGLRCLLQVALAELDAATGGAAPSPHGSTAAAANDTGLRCGAPVPIGRIAAAEDLSDVYAAKLMRQLRLAGLVESTRGASGGYRLSRPAEEISVWDAIHALDDSFLPGAACDCSPDERVDCRRTTTCAVTSLWRRLGAEIRASLEAVSLADLCAGALAPDETEPARDARAIPLPTLPGSPRPTGPRTATNAAGPKPAPPIR